MWVPLPELPMLAAYLLRLFATACCMCSYSVPGLHRPTIAGLLCRGAHHPDHGWRRRWMDLEYYVRGGGCGHEAF